MRIVPRSPALFVGRTEELARLLDTADRLRLATVCGVAQAAHERRGHARRAVQRYDLVRRHQIE